MKCSQCGSVLVKVGRQIKPGHPEIWMDAYVCRKKQCPVYAAYWHDGSTSTWPGMTLDGGVPLHAMIQGAIKFRDQVL